MTKLEVPKIVKKEKDREKDWLNEEILIEFYNLEEPGVPLKFTYGTTRNPETFTLLQGPSRLHVPVWNTLSGLAFSSTCPSQTFTCAHFLKEEKHM